MEESVVQQPSTSAWSWEGETPPPSLTPEQASMVETTIAEVKASPLYPDTAVVANGGRTAVWRYLEGAQWRFEPVRGKRVSDFFLETLVWRQDGKVDTVLDRAHTFVDEASFGKLFVRGTSLLGRPLIWVHAGWEDSASDPEASIRFLVYTVVSRSVMQAVRTCSEIWLYHIRNLISPIIISVKRSSKDTWHWWAGHESLHAGDCAASQPPSQRQSQA